MEIQSWNLNLGFGQTYLKGISTTSMEFSFIPGYIFLYILDEIMNATETNSMEQKIIIHTNWEINFQIKLQLDLAFNNVKPKDRYFVLD